MIYGYKYAIREAGVQQKNCKLVVVQRWRGPGLGDPVTEYLKNEMGSVRVGSSREILA